MKDIKKLFFIVAAFSSVFSLCFSQENADDDIDSLFEQSKDIEHAVVEENESENSKSLFCRINEWVHLSGNIDASVSLSDRYQHSDDPKVGSNKFGPSASLKNTLNFTVQPNPIFAFHANFDQTLGGNMFNPTSLYFDYLLLNRVYLTAGTVGLSWSYTRIFNNSSYYTTGSVYGGFVPTGQMLSDIVASDSAIKLKIMISWTYANLTFVTSLDSLTSYNLQNTRMYASVEWTMLHTSFQLFAKIPGTLFSPAKPKSYPVNSSPIVGGQVKKTILGFDFYGQAIADFADFSNLRNRKGYNDIVATCGLYRLWDSFDPNIGFNIEYQCEYNPKSTANIYQHRLAFEGGLKRLGRDKNMKVGAIWHHNVTEKHGYGGVNFIIAGILPYAELSNKVAIGYGSAYTMPVFILSTSISISLGYSIF